MIESGFRSIHANYGVRQRPNLDPSIRRLIYGPIRPMKEPSLLSKIFHWR